MAKAERESILRALEALRARVVRVDNAVHRVERDLLALADEIKFTMDVDRGDRS